MTDAYAQLDAWIDAHFDEQVRFLQELVRVPTDTPPGDNAPHAQRTAELLQAWGYEAERHPVPEAEVRAYGLQSITNLIVRRRYGEGRTIALNAHGDVVPPGDGWTHGPYSGDIADGRLYGRAAAVSKSDFATYTYATRAIETLRERLAGSLPSYSSSSTSRDREGSVGDTLSGLVASMGTQALPDAPFKTLLPAINEHFSHDSVATIRESLAGETRPEYRDWAAETLKVIDSRSPLAVCVTLEMLRRGRELPLAECFAMELHLDRQWFDQGDIVEGVRALIVDKDKNPRWNPPTLSEVTPQRIAGFFAGI